MTMLKGFPLRLAVQGANFPAWKIYPSISNSVTSSTILYQHHTFKSGQFFPYSKRYDNTADIFFLVSIKKWERVLRFTSVPS